MAHTLQELKEAMVSSLDADTILEILDITSEEMVDRFEDKIDDRFFGLCLDLFGNEEENEEGVTEI